MASNSEQFPEERRIYALMLRLAAMFCFAMMNVLIKLASERGVALPEIIFFRQMLSLPIIVWLIWRGPGFSSLRPQRFGALAARSLVGLICMAFAFGSITMLPLAEATTLGFVAPIFTTLLSVVVFREKVGPRRAAAILVGFVGVIIVVQPAGSHLDPAGTAMGLTAAFLVGIISFQIRDLSRTEPSTSIVFWFGALSTLLMLPALPFFLHNHDWHSWLLLAGIGSLGGIAQMGMTNSLRYAPVSTVVGMDYVSLVWATLFGWLIWSQLPLASTLIGAAIIISTCFYIIWREHRLSLQRNREVIT